MRTILSLFMLSVAPAAISSHAIADDDDHWYGGFDLGLSVSPDNKFSRSADNLLLETDKNVGPVGGIYFGKKVGARRYEFEYLIRRNYFDGFEQTGSSTTFPGQTSFGAGGLQKNSSLMVNMWQRLSTDTNWSFLLGGGVGITHVSLEGLRSGQTLIADDGDWAPTFQAMAEVVRPIGEGLELGFGYRMVRSTRASFDTAIGEAKYKASHNELFARISWRIGGGASSTPAPTPIALPEKPVTEMPAAAPAPKPTPAPAPVKAEPAPLPAPFIVYFDFDKSTLTADAYATIVGAAKAYREFKAIEIKASGHADRAGPELYNEKLAQARVMAVHDALVREGVPASKIMMSSEGENLPAIATDDGVREQKNRRVEIKLVR